MKYCCFRFDADTHVCISRGIPALVNLADKLDAKFTFFVNMGRSFDVRVTLSKALSRQLQGGRRGSLSAVKKLGWRAALKAAVLNPQAGRSNPAALLAAARSGHEIGLHGGRNHALWERAAQTWSEDRLRKEIESGLCWLRECGLPAPRAFSSPAWNSPPALLRVLPAYGFCFLVDTCDTVADEVEARGKLVSVPTNVIAEPQSAGYLEIMRLRGWSRARVTEDFRAQLATKHKLAVVYDHPFFAGIHALEQVGELVEVAQEEGFCVGTISAAAEALCAETAADVMHA